MQSNWETIKKNVSAYYKIQRWDRNSLSWVDKQVAYNSLEEAKRVLPHTVKCRIMVIEGKKRYPLE